MIVVEFRREQPVAAHGFRSFDMSDGEKDFSNP